MKSLLTTLAIVGGLMSALASPATAAVMTYTSLSAFNAATVGGVSNNFEGIAAPGDFLFGDVTVGGVNFSGATPFVIDANAGFASYGASFFSGQVPAGITATWGGSTAIGFFYGSYTDSSMAVDALLSTGDSFQLTTPSNFGVDLNFIGFVSDSDSLTSVTFSGNGLVFDITQFIVARALPNQVPEPGSMLLAGAALLALGLTRRRSAK